RMAALMKIRSIFVYTHDSIGLGEDGPTHQSIEHVASLRLIPGVDVWRPADTLEAVVAWAQAIERKDGPSCIVCSRQNVTFVDRDEVDADAIACGGYVAAEAPAGADKAELVIVATGSEMELAMKTRALLTAQNVQVRVVSMPCADAFDRQDEEYRKSVLPEGLPVLAIEAGVTGLWHKYFTGKGDVVGIDTFGESAPAGVLWKHFGFTVERCVEKALALIGR
ncbi:MAG: transketolase C-terminal domain-containing protein, partial [Sutterellaceae bacterium]|nr:transketolase C-terminal domain-containing protein [Sutterellaceae bacterium]